jgi:rhamnose utilization protein RhaD (predicted bifunctional aldolase and dehydrogenase)
VTGIVVDDLVTLSRTLGEPARQLAILAEGNTSARLDGEGPSGRMLVKASGAWLARLEPQDLVEVRLAPLVALLDDRQADDDEVTRTFTEATVTRDAPGPRPSVEALLHAACLAETPARVIAHTHPVAVNGLLCSASADLLGAGALFPDQIVVLGRHVLVVPYVDPGLPLARHVRGLLRDFLTRHGTAPRVLFLRNHGIFALGASSDEALQITEMAVKVALVLQAAVAAGGAVFLTDQHADRIDSRPDELHRRRALASPSAPSAGQEKAGPSAGQEKAAW